MIDGNPIKFIVIKQRDYAQSNCPACDSPHGWLWDSELQCWFSVGCFSSVCGFSVVQKVKAFYNRK